MSRSGVNLALLLIGGFRSLIDDALAQLSASGYGEVRPIHIIALRAITNDATNASELGRRLSVTKQAAAKTIAVLQEMGYLTRDQDQHDTRLKRLQITTLGMKVLAKAEEVFDGLRADWERQLGTQRLADLEQTLAVLVGAQSARLDTLGWMAKTEG